MIHAALGTIVVYSDLVCSFAHLAVHRLHRTRAELGLEDAVVLDHRAFPLELFNHEVNPRPGVDSETAVLGGLAPDAGWAMWHAPDWAYPSTVLPALEAVQAAKEQSWAAGEVLDLALRRAFWADSRCIAQRHVILDVAREAARSARGSRRLRRDVLDVDELAAALDDGRARRTVIDQWQAARRGAVRCSPHLFLPDGTDHPNPGITAHWANGEFGVGFPVIERDDPSVYRDLLLRAAAAAA
jgi:predicted DsbA family dithiol-disulfide isomerase